MATLLAALSCASPAGAYGERTPAFQEQSARAGGTSDRTLRELEARVREVLGVTVGPVRPEDTAAALSILPPLERLSWQARLVEDQRQADLAKRRSVPGTNATTARLRMLGQSAPPR